MKTMKNASCKQAAKERRRVRLRTQIALGYFTGRAIAFLIACALIGWFVFMQFAGAEMMEDCVVQITAGKIEKKSTLLTVSQHHPTMGLVVME